MHGLLHQAVKKSLTTLGPAAATDDFRPMHIPGGQVSADPLALIFMFHLHGLLGLGGTPRDAGGGVPGCCSSRTSKARTHPAAVVGRAIGDGRDPESVRLWARRGHVGIVWEDPAAVLSGANRILMQPAPERRAAQLGNEPCFTHVVAELRWAPTRERDVVGGGQFARQGFDLHDQLWGEKNGGDPAGNVPPISSIVVMKGPAGQGRGRVDRRFNQAPWVDPSSREMWFCAAKWIADTLICSQLRQHADRPR